MPDRARFWRRPAAVRAAGRSGIGPLYAVLCQPPWLRLMGPVRRRSHELARQRPQRERGEAAGGGQKRDLRPVGSATGERAPASEPADPGGVSNMDGSGGARLLGSRETGMVG